MDNAGGLHSPKASAQLDGQPSLQAEGAPGSRAAAGFSRPRFGHVHKRHAHTSAPPQASAQPSPSGGGGGAVTRGTDCVASPHSCGFPDATNTGADCSQLAPSGSLTVTTSGAVVEGKNISGSITVQASK